MASGQLSTGQTQRHSGNVQNLQLRFGSPLRDAFFDRSPPFFGFWSILLEPLG